MLPFKKKVQTKKGCGAFYLEWAVRRNSAIGQFAQVTNRTSRPHRPSQSCRSSSIPSIVEELDIVHCYIDIKRDGSTTFY
ncbi:hypothetical protein Y032_0323g2498 [Ancylostoma ceylanicum]|uniref:Uncharacterized protein n=1 Tax=Ancylostoma ceylanicum TaxID=53326 RepID=A0A016S1A4_9BILA|nr:hypothetical protein Y032_0323g2498 [Ancylostoma ceylanicum]